MMIGSLVDRYLHRLSFPCLLNCFHSVCLFISFSFVHCVAVTFLSSRSYSPSNSLLST
ncbi:hypothetical protein HBH56_157160 [Parastagonospora nodorum]|uniref:Uncharacterized protein n=1 Tax=Phaeosphaeria nodorum (strain SN15 / ATCC MYA-4574 / FGSC 10173) TaxID=321614 RepID=A0A7U2I2Y8_PHANO|nr:hypothetical protein HBH56_157160 [Parastagonospora nodorum]QRC97482.1 hypothetical protein JI435_410630 [Parastagonospora nodorum SN15]KAH3922875.1 hypothetical protein HBH54_217580 [Parastagonospora nodorum]KAH4106224.1 hypothetical protein HBH46_075520 [Parastagonospora nodorum]KAH4127629.1 hypothetical protein HBH45_215570 [Parastagonospora nodorum]